MKLTLRDFLLVFVFAMASVSASARVLYYVDENIGSQWSNPNHWMTEDFQVGTLPTNGDTLIFYRAYLAFQDRLIMVNDITNLVVSSLHFGFNDFDPETYVLQGNPLRVTGAIHALYPETRVEIRCDLNLAGGATLHATAEMGLDHPARLIVFNPVTFEGAGDLVLYTHYAGSIELAGPVLGNCNIRLPSYTPVEGHPALPVKLSGTQDNAFTGSVILGDGRTLELDKESAVAIPGPLFIGKNSQVSLKRSNQIADTTKVAIVSGGRLRLEGNTESIASLCLTNFSEDTLPALVSTEGSTLSVQERITAVNDSASVTPTLAGKLGLPSGNHLIHTIGSNPVGLNIQALIIGDGGFTKSGAAGLVLGGDSSFNGDAVIQEGRVDVNHNNALGSATGATVLEGGELSLNGVAVGAETLFANRSTTRVPILGAILNAVNVCSWAGPVVLNTNVTVAGGDITFSGAISGAGGVRLTGNDRVLLTGPDANTYNGDTISDAYVLELNKPSGVVAFGGRLIVGSGRSGTAEVRWLQDYQRVGAEVILYSDATATALINLNNHREDFGPITFNGGVIDTGPAGELGIYGLVSVTAWEGEAIINGRLGLPPGHHEFHVDNASRLADLAINAVVLGSGHLRKTGLGQMWLNASNSYGGLTLVEEGALVAFNADALGNPSTGTTVNEGASLILNAAGATVREPIAISGAGDGSHGALDVFGNVTLRNPFPSIFACLDLTTNATIRVEPGGVLTANGFISGTGPLTKTGPGTLVLANINPNTYSGDTFVTEGVLNLSKPNLAVAVPGNLIVGPAPLNSTAIARWSTSGGMNPNAIVTINARSLFDLNGNGLTLSRLNLNDGGDAQTGAGTLTFGFGGLIGVGSLSQFGSHASCSFSGNIGLPANATLTFAVGAYAPTAPFDFNPELNVSANIAAPVENPSFERAGIAKIGPGTMRLFGNTSFHGRVEVLDGTFIAGNGTALGSTFDGTFVQNNARLALEGSSNFENEALVLNSTAIPALENISGENYWSGSVIMHRHSTVGTRASSALQLAGIISGAANFTKVGPGTLRFGGGEHNTYTGQTFINEGVFLMSKAFAITAVPGALNIGSPAGAPATAANLVGYQIVGDIFVNRGGLLNLNGQEENVGHLWLYEGGDVQTTSGFLYLKTGGSIRVFPGAHNNPSTVTGNLGMDPGQHDFIVAPGSNLNGAPELTIGALISQPLSTTGLQKSGAGTLRLTANNTYRGLTVVNEGVLRVDGSQPLSAVQVSAAGTLKGSGYVGNITFSGIGGVVSPGASPGVLGCSSLNFGATGLGILEIELNGPSVGAGYDQLNVADFASLSGVTLRLKASFPAATNQEFVIVSVFEPDSLQGAFTGLPENGTITVNDQIFRISYAGGDGNDVVLTKMADVYRPRLTIERISLSAVRLHWPTNDPAFALQFTTNLSSTNFAGWVPVSEMPVISGTNRVVTNSSSGAHKLYRLFKP